MNPLAALLDAVHDAHLRAREAAQAPRLRACREKQPQRARKARRVPAAAPQVAPIAPPAVSPAPTFHSAPQYANIKRKRARGHLHINAPSAAQVAEKAAQLERRGVPVTRNEDGQFSAPELTAWYLSVVRIQYC